MEKAQKAKVHSPDTTEKIQPSKLRRRFACDRSTSSAIGTCSVSDRKVISHLNTALGFLSRFKLLFTLTTQTVLRLLSAFISRVPRVYHLSDHK